MDRDTSWTDSSDRKAYAKTPYKYHTYGMEVLPHELRILYDSNVIRRIPDRLTPRDNRAYDYAVNYVRTGLMLLPSEFDIDLSTYTDSLGVTHTDSLGTNSTYSAYWQAPLGTDTYRERKFFERNRDSCSGCYPDKNGHKAAHQLLDYVKVWDVPSDMKISDYQQ